MSLAVQVGNKSFEIGAASFLKAWFSTIFVLLENEDWGSLFPTVMRELYVGSVPYLQAERAMKELTSIRRQLAEFAPEQVIWDFENREARPPWGDEISQHITSLGNYFVTSDGKDLFEVLGNAFAESVRTSQDVVIT